MQVDLKLKLFLADVQEMTIRGISNDGWKLPLASSLCVYLSGFLLMSST